MSMTENEEDVNSQTEDPGEPLFDQNLTMPPPQTVPVDYSDPPDDPDQFKDFDHPDEHPPDPSLDEQIADRQRFLASKLAAITLEIKSLREQAKDAQREFRQDIEKLQESAISLAREYKNTPFEFQKTLFPEAPPPKADPPPEPYQPYSIEGGTVRFNIDETQQEPPKTRKKRTKLTKEDNDPCQTMTPGLTDQTE